MSNPQRKCDICPAAPVAFRRSYMKRGTRLYACAEHRPYLASWQAQERSEARADSLASARYERAAYGRRD